MNRFQEGLNDFVEEKGYGLYTKLPAPVYKVPKRLLIAEVVMAQKVMDNSSLDCLLTVCIENQV